jgi:hypothetical protein
VPSSASDVAETDTHCAGSARSVKAKDGGIHDHGVVDGVIELAAAVVFLTMQLGVFVLIGVVVLGIVVDSDGSG